MRQRACLASRTSSHAGVPRNALAVVFAGVAAALHLGKPPPAVSALQATLGIDLVEAGFLLSLVQVAGMCLGMVFGLVADAFGLRRSMLAGLALVTGASVLGGWVGRTVDAGPGAIHWLLALRALEGVGFLLAVMPGPGLIRTLSPPGAEKKALGLWGAYMPLGVALALLLGPSLIAWGGWPGWWWVLSAVSALAALWVLLAVPGDQRPAIPASLSPRWTAPLLDTIRASGPRTLALAFGVYSAQWMAVIGFLPAIYAGAGVPAAWNAALTALAAAMNIVGNVSGGRFLQRGVAPERLLRWGFVVMALGGVAAFAQIGAPASTVGLPPALRYVAVCLFSLAGGMIPATLFMLSTRLAPGPSTVSTTVGMMQQASSLGQFIAPPAVAWIAHRVGGWQWTWGVTLACSLAGLALAARVAPARSAAGTAR
ncbi:drug resistance transporter, Bcr/CflA subfamily [Variovorax sp. PBL-H6]|uniref:MFS transporter n=1 Tax=Variovorax sp. PBL-H6 TaxID=434009 RepID=UPI001318AFA6|nr:MFS transporter [Variovorax sp. PBL-H6]VTU19818.1 drug resistance transporter, Bcr/CflA subfamily [Variovorax sp. PBL-H6]